MRHVSPIAGGRSAAAGARALPGRRVYLAGPRTCLDPEGYALLEDSLLDLGVIELRSGAAFVAAARALRDRGALVSSPFESEWWRGADHDGVDFRAERDRDAAALEAADLVVVLDGWQDVPGAADTAILVAQTRGVGWSTVAEALAGAAAGITVPAAPLRRRAS